MQNIPIWAFCNANILHQADTCLQSSILVPLYLFSEVFLFITIVTKTIGNSVKPCFFD